jgi:uncharacterized RDD family membrane protein YckC
MKCPKCDYLGFETGDRCKNCGYDFSLLAAPANEPAELSLKTASRDDVSIGDLWLDPVDATPRAFLAPDPPASIESFPLFSPGGDDEPLIKTPSEPRAPLSVRRTPDLSRSRSASRPRSIDPGLSLQFAEETFVETAPPVTIPEPTAPLRSELAAPLRPEVASLLKSEAPLAPSSAPLSAASESTASLGSRTLAAVIDHAILLAIDVIVFYSTLRMTALSADEWRALPALPLLAFLVFMKLAYFAAFTAMGGQTIGKMAAGIRVVADDHFIMDPPRAITRTLTGAVSLATLGLGLIPALIGPDRRALHDRVAHTHVVDLPSA